MTEPAAPKLVRPAPRTIIVVWRDGEGNEVRERRHVYFLNGYGHYVKWNRRDIFVEPLQDEVRVDALGPKLRRPL